VHPLRRVQRDAGNSLNFFSHRAHRASVGGS
jgi:hypothetical protein